MSCKAVLKSQGNVGEFPGSLVVETFCLDYRGRGSIRVSACLRAQSSDSWRTPWTLARQAPLSVGFSGQEYWSGLPCSPPPGDLHNPGVKPPSPASLAF